MEELKDCWNTLLSELTQEILRVRELIVTKEEEAQQKYLIDTLDARMQTLVLATCIHLEQYQVDGWKELVRDDE